MRIRRVRRWDRPLSGGVAAVCLGLAMGAAAKPAAAPTRPVDPDAVTPHLAAPGGQPRDDRRRWGHDWSGRGASSRRRVALSLSPMFASYRLAFLGRPSNPIRGGGLGTDLDIELISPVGLRLSASYTGHRVFDEYDHPDDGPPTLAARGGTLHTIDFGGAVVFAMDIGRVRPVLEAGLGAMIIRSPSAAVDGQRGGACLPNGGCDVGLACATAENVCRQGVVPRAHAGAGIEVLLGDRWSIAAMIRYFSLLTAPTVFPVYLQAGVRLSVRF